MRYFVIQEIISYSVELTILRNVNTQRFRAVLGTGNLRFQKIADLGRALLETAMGKAKLSPWILCQYFKELAL